MALILFNTFSKQKEAFKPINPDRVTMYVCGPTVYNYIHVGNARPFVVFDVLFRVLKQHYDNVCYARNVTDVDDKINQAAIANKQTIQEFTQYFIEAFHHDIVQLKTLEPSIEPKATEHIPQMIALIEKMIEQGHAYYQDDHVLFDVPSLKNYGNLSKRKRDDLIAGARVEVADYKKDFCDFVLWKPSKPDEPSWDSPWGAGRPGWHLECSAMIHAHLGKTIDIHGGGHDLIFPHHENELAQSCGAYPGESFVNYWVHNGFVTVDDEKMSKSLGNFFTLREALKQYPGEVIRYALLSAHYRAPLNWSIGLLDQAKASLDRLYGALLKCQDKTSNEQPVIDEKLLAALDDDLNTSLALSRLHELARDLNKTSDVNEVMRLKSLMLGSANLLGFLTDAPEQWLQHSGCTAEIELSEVEIDNLIKKRNQAKIDKDYATADSIRDQLDCAEIILEDSVAGTRWRRK